MPLRICFLSAEYSPFSKSGGLGDVAAALTNYLATSGHDVRTFVPLHSQSLLEGSDVRAVDFLQDMTVQCGTRTFAYGVSTARAPGSKSQIYLVDCPELFDRPRIYTDAPDEHVRFLMLTRAALECCQRM